MIPSGSTSVSAYFPPAKWYDWYTHQVTSAEGGETKQLDTPVDHIQVELENQTQHVPRGGTAYMIATHSISAWSSEQSKSKGMKYRHRSTPRLVQQRVQEVLTILELSGWSKVPLIAQQECKRRLVDHLVAVLTKQIAVNSPPPLQSHPWSTSVTHFGLGTLIRACPNDCEVILSDLL